MYRLDHLDKNFFQILLTKTLAQLRKRAFTDDPSLVEGFSELDLLHNGTRESLLNILGTSRADARLGEDENGDLFLSTKHGGTIFQLGLVTDVPEPEVPPSAIALLAGLLWLSTKSRAAFRPGAAFNPMATP